MKGKEQNPVGRPTKYSNDMQAQADEYIFKYSEVGDVIPFRVRFSSVGASTDLSVNVYKVS